LAYDTPRGLWQNLCDMWKLHSDPKLVITTEDDSIKGVCSECGLVFQPDPNLGTGIVQDAYLQEQFEEHAAKMHSAK